MKNTKAMQKPVRQREQRDPKALLVRAGLAAIFLLGAALVFMGYRGRKLYESYGFAGGEGFQTIYQLSASVSEIWEGQVRKEIGKQTAEEQEKLHETAVLLLNELWEENSLNSSAGASAENVSEEGLSAENVSGEGLSAENASGEGTSSENAPAASSLQPELLKDRDLSMKLLYTAYLVKGPKVSTSNRKKIQQADPEEAARLRQELLACVLDDTRSVPSAVKKAVSKLEGTERTAMLMQAFFTSCNTDSQEKLTEQVNAFKKGVRGKEEQLEAFQMIAGGKMSWGWQLVISRSRTIILLGVLLMLDMALLTMFMASDRRWRFDAKWLLVLLIIDFLLVFQLLPLVYISARALFPEGRLTFRILQRLFSYSLNREAVRNTLITAFSTMVLGTLIAFPLAFLVGRTNLYGRKFFRALFVLTYMVPPYVGAMAWLRLMNPNVGVINLWLRRLLPIGNGPGPLNVYSVPGMIWVLTSFYYPYAFITISRAMEKMDPSLEDASRISGASPVKTIFKITLPLMMPSLLAGALLVFVAAASCYGIPSIIGKPGNVSTVTTRIVEYTALGQQGVNDAISLSVFLMGISLLILFISDVVLARRQYITVSGKSVSPSIVHLRSFRIPLTIAVSLFAVIMIVLPFATILTTSFKVDVGKSVLAAHNFTTQNWKIVFSRTETLSCLKNSLLFSAAAATAGILISCVMNYLMQRTRIRGRSIPNFLITLGSGTPSVVIALGLIMTMRGSFGIYIYGTAYIMIVAYMIKYLMMGMRTVASAMSQIHVSLEECSQISGAGWLYTMRRITWPLISPSIAAGWFLIFIPCFYELSMTTLLYSSTTKTIGFELYEYWTFTSQPMSCAMAFGILLAVTFLNFLLAKLTGGKFSI